MRSRVSVMETKGLRPWSCGNQHYLLDLNNKISMLSKAIDITTFRNTHLCSTLPTTSQRRRIRIHHTLINPHKLLASLLSNLNKPR